jgi:hypothetical protein
MNFNLAPLLPVLLLSLLAACGGGGSSAPPAAPPPVSTTPARPDWETLQGSCVLGDQLKWLRSFIDESYLWYREVPTNLNMANYSTPPDYFAVLKTPLLTASGRAKDRFHFTYPTEVWNAMSDRGVELSYGVTWARGTNAAGQRVWTVAMVEAGSPAAAADMRRGDLLLTVDGVSITSSTSAGVAALNAGLFPETAGEIHRMVLTRAGQQLTAVLTSQQLELAPVQNVKVIATDGGKVGYLQFNDHNAVAEARLFDAFAGFKAAGVDDLVLDMRYNGGGLLSIAAELAYMIAGPEATRGRAFERLQFNDKMPAVSPQIFPSTALGNVPAALKPGTALPYLGLKRVTVLTTPATCSASEAVVNGLRGADIEVTLIGGETCGKPYAFLPEPNCGTTYFAIQIQGANDKGFGDYADGFQPTCRVADDLGHALGDPAESLLATALSHRANGVCPAVPLRSRAQSALPAGMELVRPDVKSIAILNR